jgi:hypothetical protein
MRTREEHCNGIANVCQFSRKSPWLALEAGLIDVVFLKEFFERLPAVDFRSHHGFNLFSENALDGFTSQFESVNGKWKASFTLCTFVDIPGLWSNASLVPVLNRAFSLCTLWFKI